MRIENASIFWYRNLFVLSAFIFDGWWQLNNSFVRCCSIWAKNILRALIIPHVWAHTIYAFFLFHFQLCLLRLMYFNVNFFRVLDWKILWNFFIYFLKICSLSLKFNFISNIYFLFIKFWFEIEATQEIHRSHRFNYGKLRFLPCIYLELRKIKKKK